MPSQQLFQQANSALVPQACLIIEDSKFDQLKMKRMISRSLSGMQVYVAATLREARQTLAKYPVSMILLDNRLPDGLGADFAVELSTLGVFPMSPLSWSAIGPPPLCGKKPQQQACCVWSTSQSSDSTI